MPGADKGILRDLKSGIQKFFTIQSQLHPDLKKEQFLPNQKRFVLESPEDPNPKPVFGFNVVPGSPKKVGPAHDGRHLGNTDPTNATLRVCTTTARCTGRRKTTKT
jgi:hypothetical protein